MITNNGISSGSSSFRPIKAVTNYKGNLSTTEETTIFDVTGEGEAYISVYCSNSRSVPSATVTMEIDEITIITDLIYFNQQGIGTLGVGNAGVNYGESLSTAVLDGIRFTKSLKVVIGTASNVTIRGMVKYY